MQDENTYAIVQSLTRRQRRRQRAPRRSPPLGGLAYKPRRGRLRLRHPHHPVDVRGPVGQRRGSRGRRGSY